MFMSLYLKCLVLTQMPFQRNASNFVRPRKITNHKLVDPASAFVESFEIFRVNICQYISGPLFEQFPAFWHASPVSYHSAKKKKVKNFVKSFMISNNSDGSNNVRNSMFNRLKPKIGCSSSINIR